MGRSMTHSDVSPRGASITAAEGDGRGQSDVRLTSEPRVALPVLNFVA
jgi:hypothetical protein